MSREKVSAAEGLITSDAVQAGAKLRRRIMIIAVIVLAAAVIGAGAWLLVTKTSLLSRSSGSPQTGTETLTPAQAIAAAQARVDSAKTATEKAAAYSDLGHAYLTNNQADQAVAAYKSAVSATQTTGGSSSGGSSSANVTAKNGALTDLASAYVAAGETDQAIAAYKQIVQNLQGSGSAEDRSLVPKYQRLISQLESL